MSEAYLRTLDSERWRSLKMVRLAVAGFRCEDCGWRWVGRTPRQALAWFDLHHVTYERVGSERLEDVRVLCRDCHELRHGRHVATCATS